MAKEFFAAIIPDQPVAEEIEIEEDYFSWKAQSNKRLLSEFLDVRGQSTNVYHKKQEVEEFFSDRCTLDD